MTAQAVPKQTISADRLRDLRAELERRGLDGFLVPMADEYQNEYVPLRAKRIEWLTGFTGSAGLVVVLTERAAVFTDGRYTLQVADQVDGDLYDLRHIVDAPATDWIGEHLPAGAKLGYDPWLFTADGVRRFAEAAEKAGGALTPVDGNPIDVIWTDQPPAPMAPVVPHDVAYSGQPSAEKRAQLAEQLRKDGIDAAVVTASDSIAWLLNVRGDDVSHTPLPLSLAVLHADAQVDFFLDGAKRSEGLDAHLGNEVAIQTPDSFGPALDKLGQDGKTVLADPAVSANWVFDRLDKAGAKIVRGADPCQLPKACKNETELNGTRAAHRRDGAAVTRFLQWLDENAAGGAIDEIAAADHLAGLRAENDLFRDLSFDTISGAGPNGAIVHYRVTPESNRKLEPGTLYLVDSGAQYLDGTTDITRTIAVGEPTAEMRDRFTRVLKGHIAIATCRFPEGTTGSQIDVLARHALWQAGLDFDHGTGHGVGSYLGVHEGPQRVAKVGNTVALKPGMIVSNEPGYYKTDGYGIRIENLVAVVTADEMADAERPMLKFETLTFAPIDLNLVEPDMLSDDEKAWLNAYHADVRAILSPQIDAASQDWLAKATRSAD